MAMIFPLLLSLLAPLPLQYRMLTNIDRYCTNIDKILLKMTVFDQKHTFFQKGMSKKPQKKRLRLPAPRKQLLGLPIHIKVLVIFINIGYTLNIINQHTLLVLTYSLLATPYCY